MSIPTDSTRFAAEEYLALWREHGLESLSLDADGLWSRMAAPGPSPATDVPVVFVGEGPAEELLAKIIDAMGLAGRAVYFDVEAAPARLKELSPQVVVALGEGAVRRLTSATGSLPSLRGKFLSLAAGETIPVMPTYDPAHLKRHPLAKREVWSDMKLVLGRLR